MSLDKILPSVILMGIISIFVVFFVTTMAAVDSGVDMSGSDYEDQYDAVTDSSQAPIEIIKYVPTFLALGVLIISLMFVYKRK